VNRIWVFGTFDILSSTLVQQLEEAKRDTHSLIVGLYTDACARMSQSPCLRDFEQRKCVLEALRAVDFVMPISHPEQARVFPHKTDRVIRV
jgi:glycerol-3-phosphate cytidylyltransferase